MKESRAALRCLVQANEWIMMPFPQTPKNGGGRNHSSPFSLTFSLFPNPFSFSPSNLAFQGKQLSQGYMLTFRHAFFPPSSLSDILMTFAGLAFHG